MTQRVVFVQKNVSSKNMFCVQCFQKKMQNLKGKSFPTQYLTEGSTNITDQLQKLFFTTYLGTEKTDCCTFESEMFPPYNQLWFKCLQIILTPGLLLWSRGVVINKECGLILSFWNKQDFPWKKHCLNGNISGSADFSLICMYRSAFMVSSWRWKLPIPCNPIPPQTLAFDLYTDEIKPDDLSPV